MVERLLFRRGTHEPAAGTRFVVCTGLSAMSKKKSGEARLLREAGLSRQRPRNGWGSLRGRRLLRPVRAGVKSLDLRDG